MADTSLSAVVRHLRQIASPATDPRDDHELLTAFAVRQEQAAFAMLVRRHGPMVLNVCRRVLRHEQDAEDAFQATFLVLAAKAAVLSIRTGVAGFLHGVAYRLALKARREATRRRRREACAPIPVATDVAAELSWREVQAVVEEEMQRLPDKYRLPFVLCHLQGLSRAEAGRQLGLKEGTVWSRLAQARARLQQRLERRGIALAAVLGALAVSETPVRASLIEGVVYAARPSATGAVSANVAMLTQAGLQAMTGKMKVALLGLVILLAAGAGGVGYQTLTAQAPEMPAATTPQANAAPEPKKPEAPRVRADRHGDPLPEGAIARLGTVRWRHGFVISALAYSPDGKLIAANGAGRALTLWDAATGKEVRSFPNNGQPIGLAFSPDGKMLATTDNPYCYLWDVATGKELRRLKGHKDVVRGVAFSPDGKLAATAGSEGTVRLWDPATGKELRRIDCGSGEVCRLAYSPDGSLIASTHMDGTIQLWDPATGKERRRLSGHKNAIWFVVFAPDGKRLATSSNDGTIRLWDVATGRQLRILAEEVGDETPIAFSPDGLLLAGGCPEGTIRLWEVKDGAEKRSWPTGALGVRTLAFSPDGKTLASGVTFGVIRLWDVDSGRERHPSDEPHGFINLVRFSPDGSSLVSISNDSRLLWWDLTTQTPRRQFTWTVKARSPSALSPDGNTLAVGTWSDFKKRLWEIRLWDVRTGKAGHFLGKHEGMGWPIVFSPDGRLVASGGRDHCIRLWDVSTGKEIRQIRDVPSDIWSLCFSPDSKALACGTYPDGPVSFAPALHLWDLASGEKRCSFTMHFSYVTALAFSPDGKVIATGDASRNGRFVRLWDAANGKELSCHTGHQEDVGAVAFSPDGKLVASGAGSLGQKDNSVHVWEAATGRLIRRFEGHHSCIGSVAFSPDGLTVASGAGDSTILLWDITGRRMDGRWHAKSLTPPQLEACWTALADADAAKAYDAVWMLVAAPEQALPLLRKQLSPVPRPDAQIVARLIADLDSEDFRKREKATEELTKLGDAAAPALRQALQGKPALEMRRRLQQLLDQGRDWSAERLREHRAIQALEHIGTPQAKEVLQALAAGAPGVYRTEAAETTLRRMRR
jgi:RNA polymerase sigma factor (sigma-70 family)